MSREGWVSDYNADEIGRLRAPGCTCSDKQLEIVGCECFWEAAGEMTVAALDAWSRDRSELAAWFVSTVGYDPFADDPEATIESVRRIRDEYLAAAGET